MENTLKSNLVLPSMAYELDREEMSYVEGGGITEAMGYIADVIVAVAGLGTVAAIWAKGVGFFAGVTVKAAAWGTKVALATSTFVGPGLVTFAAAIATAAVIIIPIVGLVASNYFSDIMNNLKNAGRELGINI